MYPRALIYTDHPLTRCDLYSSRCERLITTGKHSCTVEQLVWNTERYKNVSNNSVTLVIGPVPEVWLIRVLGGVALDCGAIALLQAIIPIIGASIAIIGAISATITIPIITSLPPGSYIWCPLLKNRTRFHFDLFSFANHWKNRPHHKSLAPPILFHFMHQLHQKIAPAPSFYFALSGFFSLTISPASDLDHI